MTARSAALGREPSGARRTLVEICRWGLFGLFAGGIAVGLLAHTSMGRQQLFLVPALAYAAVGLLVSARQPRSPIGWLFLLVAALTGLSAMADGAMTTALANGDPTAWYGVWGAWVTSWFWFPLFAAATLFTVLLFPDGLLSPRWRPVLWVSVVGTALVTVGTAMSAHLPVGKTNDPPCHAPQTLLDGTCGVWVDNPIGVRQATLETVGGVVVMIVLLALTVCFLLAVVSAVLRTRRATGTARLQMRWFAFAAAILAGWLLLQAGFVKNDPIWSEVCFSAAVAFIPVSCGLAITRYHLYDIDRIVSRTTSYAIVTGLLLATYLGVVALATSVLGRSSSLAVAGATLAAAALARPVLRRVQDTVDRRFNRERYDALHTVDSFGSRLRHEVDADHVRDDLVRVISSTLQPERVTVWIREGV